MRNNDKTTAYPNQSFNMIDNKSIILILFDLLFDYSQKTFNIYIIISKT